MKNTAKYIKEIEKERSVKSHFNKQQDLYSSDINLALYMDLSDIQKLHVFDIIQVNDRQDFLVNFYGFRMGLDDHTNERLYKLFIREMDPLLRTESKRKYSVVVFDSLSESKNCFDDFRDIFKRLPALYFAKLNKVYHVEPGFLTRTLALVHFTSWSKMFYKHVEYVDSVQNLQQVNDLKIFNIWVKCPRQITRGIKVPQPTPGMINSAFVGTMKPKPFDSLKKEFKDYKIDQAREVPLILSILIETMKQNRELCTIEGIFRIAASIEDEEELLKEISQIKIFRILDSQTYCKRSIAGLMKKIFTESITPLIPYPVYNHIMNQKIDQTNILSLWKIIINQLPKLNKLILCYVTQFLRDFILKNKEQNKMNEHNLAVVFNPCFFRAKQSSLTDLMNSGKFAAFYKWWLQHYDEVIDKTRTPQQNLQEGTLLSSERQRRNIQKIQNEDGVNRQPQKLSD